MKQFHTPLGLFCYKQAFYAIAEKYITGSSKKNLGKFSETCSGADGMCIGRPRLVGRVETEADFSPPAEAGAPADHEQG